MFQDLARSLHAAVQVPSFAQRPQGPFPDELFIGSLLYKIGDMAFWCFSGE